VWWRREKAEVSEFLYRLLVQDAPRGYARQVAERMGVPYPTLSKYWLGRRRFPASLVRPLFLATGEDLRVAEFFLLAGSGHRLVRADSGPVPEDLTRAILALSSLEARVSEQYLGATAPDSDAGTALSPREAEALSLAVQKLIAHAEAVRAALARVK
jgi:transcriptional regulator with XRE-family HTH domain